MQSTTGQVQRSWMIAVAALLAALTLTLTQTGGNNTPDPTLAAPVHHQAALVAPVHGKALVAPIHGQAALVAPVHSQQLVAPIHNHAALVAPIHNQQLVAPVHHSAALVAPHIGMGAALVAPVHNAKLVAPIHLAGALVANGPHPSLVAVLIQVLR